MGVLLAKIPLSMEPTVWKCKTVLDRHMNCIRMLHVHGLMTDGERAKITARLTKQLKEQKKQTTKPKK